MSINLKEDETIIAQCMVQGLTTLLTTHQLIIITPVKEESYSVQDILAIDVYEDTQTYNEMVRKENKRKLVTSSGFGALYGSSLGLIIFLFTNVWQQCLFFIVMGITLGAVFPKWPSSITKEALLTIILKNGMTIQHRFAKVDISEHHVKTFAEQVFRLVTKKTSMTNLLN